MPAKLTGIIASTLLFLNTIFWATILFSLTILKIIIPITFVRKILKHINK